MTLQGVTRDWFASLPVAWRTVRRWLLVVVLEAYLVVAYFALTSDAPADELRYLAYPFVWMNAGAWAVLRTSPSPGNRWHRLLAGAVGAVYFLALLVVPGNLAVGTAGAPVALRVEMYAPGWGPLMAFTSPWLRLFLVPFEAIGYAALAYLVYANALDVTRGTLSGVLGLVTCVGCTVPVLAPLVGLLGGPASGLTSTAYEWSYDLGTLFFLLAVGLLYWSQRGRRP